MPCYSGMVSRDMCSSVAGPLILIATLQMCEKMFTFVLVLGYCVSYFYANVIKHHDQGNLQSVFGLMILEG